MQKKGLSALVMPHPGGRPPKYRDEFCDEMVEFCGRGYSLTAYAGEIGVCRDTITEWAKVHAEFSLACKRAKAACGRWWEERGRTVAETGGGGGQANMINFGLRNMSPDDWREKVTTEVTGADGAPLVPTLNVVLSNGPRRE
jgi:hypothetical protein